MHILCNLSGTQMTMIIYNGQRPGIIMEQMLCSICGQQKILIHKFFHSLLLMRSPIPLHFWSYAQFPQIFLLHQIAFYHPAAARSDNLRIGKIFHHVRLGNSAGRHKTHLRERCRQRFNRIQPAKLRCREEFCHREPMIDHVDQFRRRADARKNRDLVLHTVRSNFLRISRSYE